MGFVIFGLNPGPGLGELHFTFDFRMCSVEFVTEAVDKPSCCSGPAKSSCVSSPLHSIASAAFFSSH